MLCSLFIMFIIQATLAADETIRTKNQSVSYELHFSKNEHKTSIPPIMYGTVVQRRSYHMPDNYLIDKFQIDNSKNVQKRDTDESSPEDTKITNIQSLLPKNRPKLVKNRDDVLLGQTSLLSKTVEVPEINATHVNEEPLSENESSTTLNPTRTLDINPEIVIERDTSNTVSFENSTDSNTNFTKTETESSTENNSRSKIFKKSNHEKDIYSLNENYPKFVKIMILNKNIQGTSADNSKGQSKIDYNYLNYDYGYPTNITNTNFQQIRNRKQFPVSIIRSNIQNLSRKARQIFLPTSIQLQPYYPIYYPPGYPPIYYPYPGYPYPGRPRPRRPNNGSYPRPGYPTPGNHYLPPNRPYPTLPTNELQPPLNRPRVTTPKYNRRTTTEQPDDYDENEYDEYNEYDSDYDSTTRRPQTTTRRNFNEDDYGGLLPGRRRTSTTSRSIIFDDEFTRASPTTNIPNFNDYGLFSRTSFSADNLVSSTHRPRNNLPKNGHTDHDNKSSDLNDDSDKASSTLSENRQPVSSVTDRSSGKNTRAGRCVYAKIVCCSSSDVHDTLQNLKNCFEDMACPKQYYESVQHLCD